MELSEVTVQQLGAFTWCSPRKTLLGVYWVFFRNLISDLPDGVSSSAFNIYQGMSFLLVLTAGKGFPLSGKVLDELWF